VHHTYDGQIVDAGGDPDKTQERMLSASTGATRYPGPTSANGSIHFMCYASAGDTQFLYEAEGRHIESSGASHTIEGYAYYGTLQPTLC
jgi:hypothetical protein